MMRGQVLPALFAALVDEGVDPALVERAVGRVRAIPLGASVTGESPLLRAFAFEQAGRLEGDGPRRDDDELGAIERAETQRLTPLHPPTQATAAPSRTSSIATRWPAGPGWQKPVAPPDASSRPAGMPPKAKP